MCVVGGQRRPQKATAARVAASSCSSPPNIWQLSGRRSCRRRKRRKRWLRLATAAMAPNKRSSSSSSKNSASRATMTMPTPPPPPLPKSQSSSRPRLPLVLLSLSKPQPQAPRQNPPSRPTRRPLPPPLSPPFPHRKSLLPTPYRLLNHPRRPSVWKASTPLLLGRRRGPPRLPLLTLTWSRPTYPCQTLPLLRPLSRPSSSLITPRRNPRTSKHRAVLSNRRTLPPSISRPPRRPLPTRPWQTSTNMPT